MILLYNSHVTMAANLHSDIGASMSKVRSNVARTMHVRILKNNLQKVKCFEKTLLLLFCWVMPYFEKLYDSCFK